MNDKLNTPSTEPRPATHPIAVARPCFGEDEATLLLEVLRSGWVTQGPRVAEFEQGFARAVGAPHAVAVSSGTAALFLSLHACGIGAGDEVLVPSLSFIASANAIVHCGAMPVFVDIDPDTLNIDPAAIEAAVTPRTSAIMVVHQLGLPADLDTIAAIAARHQLRIIEDAACAAGSRYKGKAIGGGPHPSCFSFHPRKVLVTGEGGMITTHDTKLAARLRRLRHQGMSVSDLDRHQASGLIIEDYPEIGYNFRLSDLHAALGIAQLARLAEFVAQRRALAARYRALLCDLPGIHIPTPPDYAETNYQSFAIRLRQADAKMRNRILERLHLNGIGARRAVMATHLEPCYAGRGSTRQPLPHTEAAAAQTLVLPLYPYLSEPDQDTVVEHLRWALQQETTSA